MSLSIAAVANERVSIAHPSNVSKIVLEIKKRTKAMKSSVQLRTSHNITCRDLHQDSNETI